VEDCVNEYGNLGPDTFRNLQTIKAHECIRDVVGAMQVESQQRGCIADWLQTTKDRWEVYQGTVAIV